MALVSPAESSDGCSWPAAHVIVAAVYKQLRSSPVKYVHTCEISAEKIVTLLFNWLYEVKCKHVIFFEGI